MLCVKACEKFSVIKAWREVIKVSRVGTVSVKGKKCAIGWVGDFVPT